MSKFSCVKPAPPIEVFAINRALAEDTHPNKVNLGVGGKTQHFFSTRPKIKLFKKQVRFWGNE